MNEAELKAVFGKIQEALKISEAVNTWKKLEGQIKAIRSETASIEVRGSSVGNHTQIFNVPPAAASATLFLMSQAVKAKIEECELQLKAINPHDLLDPSDAGDGSGRVKAALKRKPRKKKPQGED